MSELYRAIQFYIPATLTFFGVAVLLVASATCLYSIRMYIAGGLAHFSSMFLVYVASDAWCKGGLEDMKDADPLAAAIIGLVPIVLLLIWLFSPLKATK